MTDRRQLASRARRPIRAQPTVSDADLPAQREIVDAFLAASRRGDFDALVRLLDPDVVLRADVGPPGPPIEVRGATAVARQAATYSRLGLAMRPALINGAVGVITTRDGQPFAVGGVTVHNGAIIAIDILADPHLLRQLDLTPLNLDT